MQDAAHDIDEAEWLKLENQFCFMLYSTSHALTRAYGPLLQALELTYPQYLAMLVLWEQDGISVKQLGQKLLLDSGTLTPLLKRLEAAGWLKRVRSAHDERLVEIRLTEAGRDLRVRARQLPEQILCLSKMPLPQLGEMREQLRVLRQHLLEHNAQQAGQDED
ncbi:MarR family transcriptional regulator [Massilia sp. W12]|uniref:MarR family winged helix-turn-helix transcriptional regulator n=1 Tax=Massilia sp. W12 TaxID=3126507 RepID=UPI0030D3BF5D